MEVKRGYKQTEVGVIPQEWEVRRLGDLGKCLRGVSYNGDADLSTHDTPTTKRLLRSNNVQDAAILTNDVQYVNAARVSMQQILKRGDILVCMANGSKALVGKAGRFDLDDGYEYTFGAFMGCFRTNSEDSNAAFVFYLFQTGQYRNFISDLLAGSSINNLRPSSIESLEFAFPPLPEQRAIAAALSDVDALLDGLDGRIAKQRDVKQAAMQQLLTGRTRLPGFRGEWEVRRLGEVGNFLKGSGVKKDEANGGELPCIRYGEIYTHHNDYIRSFNSWVSRAVADQATRLRKGDIVFAGSGETKKEIGKCVAFVNDFEAFAGGDTVILRPWAQPTEVDALFLGYLLNTPAIATQKASQGQGDAVVHISAKALASIFVPLPPLPEQRAIAAALSDMDAALAALEARREKTRALKQAMMQDLLTGRVRLV